MRQWSIDIIKAKTLIHIHDDYGLNSAEEKRNNIDNAK